MAEIGQIEQVATDIFDPREGGGEFRLHPNIAHYYHQKIADLRATLTGETRSPEAIELVRQLIERIVLTPTRNDAKPSLTITLEGHMAAILALATKQKAPLDESDATLKVTKLVAGARLSLIHI